MYSYTAGARRAAGKGNWVARVTCAVGLGEPLLRFTTLRELIKPIVIPANKCRVHIIPMYNDILLAIRQPDSIFFWYDSSMLLLT